MIPYCKFLVERRTFILFFAGLEEQLGEISLDRHQIQNAFSFTNDMGQTALHLSILHRMPEEFITAVVLKMEKCELDQQDVNGCQAMEYLVGKAIYYPLACFVLHTISMQLPVLSRLLVVPLYHLLPLGKLRALIAN